MGVSFLNCHTGWGGWHIRRAELRPSPRGKQEMHLTVLLHFPLAPISCEAGCSASHKQSFFQLQNIPQPGSGSFPYSSHFTGTGAEHGDEKTTDLCCRIPLLQQGTWLP